LLKGDEDIIGEEAAEVISCMRRWEQCLRAFGGVQKWERWVSKPSSHGEIRILF
jgi:hypothetical protein